MDFEGHAKIVTNAPTSDSVLGRERLLGVPEVCDLAGFGRVTVSKIMKESSKFARIEIPVPPMEVQRRVVRILDKFSALTISLTDGLPAEIEARRKQYAHYRDRLLDFPRKGAVA